MRGDNQYVGFLYDTVIFLKAAVNSIDRLLRGVSVDENRRGIGLYIGGLAIASMGLYAWNRNNPLYEQLEDWDKDGYWHLFVPTAAYFAARARGEEIAPEDAYQYSLRLPKLWEIGAVSSVAEQDELEGILERPAGRGTTQKPQRAAPTVQRRPAAVRGAADRACHQPRPVHRAADRDARDPDKSLLPFARCMSAGYVVRLCSASPNWNARCRRSCKSRRRRCSISLEATSIHGPPTAWASPIGHRLRVCRPRDWIPWPVVSTLLSHRSRRVRRTTSAISTTPSRPPRKHGAR